MSVEREMSLEEWMRKLPESHRANVELAALRSRVEALENALREADGRMTKLYDFADAIMTSWPEGGMDGGDLQKAAIDCGLLAPTEPKPTEPCGDDCACAEHFGDDEWKDGIECYRKTPVLTAPLPDLAALAGETGKGTGCSLSGG